MKTRATTAQLDSTHRSGRLLVWCSQADESRRRSVPGSRIGQSNGNGGTATAHRRTERPRNCKAAELPLRNCHCGTASAELLIAKPNSRKTLKPRNRTAVQNCRRVDDRRLHRGPFGSARAIGKFLGTATARAVPQKRDVIVQTRQSGHRVRTPFCACAVLRTVLSCEKALQAVRSVRASQQLEQSRPLCRCHSAAVAVLRCAVSSSRSRQSFVAFAPMPMEW